MKTTFGSSVRYILSVACFVVLGACAADKQSPSAPTLNPPNEFTSTPELTNTAAATHASVPTNTPTSPPTTTPTETPTITSTNTPTPIENQIAFYGIYRDGNKGIFRMNPDGTDVTHIVDMDYYSYRAIAGGTSDTFSFSPDGNWITYSSKSRIDGSYDIYIVDVDGTIKIKVTNTPEGESFPSWSPDGKYIAYVITNTAYILDVETFESEKIGEIINAEHLKQITWSPDSNTVTFLAQGGFGTIPGIFSFTLSAGTLESFVSSPRGDLKRVSDLTWSPNGEYIAFFSGINPVDLFVAEAMAPDEATSVFTDRDAGILGTIDWSPNGSLIVYSANGERVVEEKNSWKNGWNLYTIEPNGKNAAKLTEHPEYASGVMRLDSYSDPVFSPDGSEIAFVSQQDGDTNIFVMNADGSEQTNLTNGVGSNYFPQWQPSNTSEDIQIPLDKGEVISIPKDTATPTPVPVAKSLGSSDSGSKTGVTPDEILESLERNGYLCDADNSSSNPSSWFCEGITGIEGSQTYNILVHADSDGRMDFISASIKTTSGRVSRVAYYEFLEYIAALPFIHEPDLKYQAQTWVVEPFLAPSEDEMVSLSTRIQNISFLLAGSNESEWSLNIIWQK